MLTPHNILVPTDFGEAAEAALTYGRALARTYGAKLHVFHARENSFLRPSVADPRDLHASIVSNLQDRLSDDDRRALRAHAVVEVSDSPAEAIIDYAKNAGIDLIVIGTHGRTGLDHLLIGSVAEHVVRASPCPVLTVRHPEREFVLPDPASPSRVSAGD